MTTIFERTATALATLSIPYALGQYLTAAGVDLPDLYLTFTETGNPAQHADDVETQRTYQIEVVIHSRSGLVALPDVDTAMLAAGFTRGADRQVPYDQESRHFALAKDFYYLD